MRFVLFFTVVLVAFSSAHALNDSKKRAAQIRDAFETWEKSTAQANRNYHRDLLNISQAEKKDLESRREKAARSKDYDKVTELTGQIEDLDQEIDSLYKHLRNGTSPLLTDKVPDDDVDEKANDDWYKGDWTLYTSDSQIRRSVASNKTVVGMRDIKGEITSVTSDMLVTKWDNGEREERWYLHKDNNITVVALTRDGVFHAGILKRD